MKGALTIISVFFVGLGAVAFVIAFMMWQSAGGGWAGLSKPWPLVYPAAASIFTGVLVGALGEICGHLRDISNLLRRMDYRDSTRH